MSVSRMSRVSTAVVVALGWIHAGAVSAWPADARPIDWRADLPAARAEAESSRRLVWLQFTGPWCHQCRKMEVESFTDPAVIGHAASDFVPVKLRSDEHEELALGFGLSALPATVILRPGGETVAKVQGYLDADAYQAFLLAALARDGRRPARAVEVAGPPDRRGPALRRAGLDGFCPVSLVDVHKLVAGKPDLTLTHEGRVYRFSGDDARQTFRKNPERYAPVNGGRCPVSQVDRGESRDGSPRWGAVYEGHLYLFVDEAGRREFLERPLRYADVDVADRGFCPHCRAAEGLLVRGRPALSLTRDGRRYLFPDVTHREAFLAPADGTRR